MKNFPYKKSQIANKLQNFTKITCTPRKKQATTAAYVAKREIISPPPPGGKKKHTHTQKRAEAKHDLPCFIHIIN